jgi:hypothetical protein
LQSFLENIPITGIAATSIAKYQQIQSLSIMLAAVLFSPMSDTVAAKFAGIMAGIEVDITFVSRQIIDAVWNQFAFAHAGKVMIQGFHRSLREGQTFTRKIPDEFFFLAVNTDHRPAFSEIDGLYWAIF